MSKIRLCLRFAALLALVSCGNAGDDGGTGPGDTEVASVSVTPPSADLLVGETVQLSAAAQGEDGQDIENVDVNWSSDDEAVAIVDGDGTVTALGAGDATITAAVDGVEGTAAITVSSEPLGAGRIRVTTATTGDDIDPDGYTVTVNDGSARPIGVNAAVTIAGIPAGTHTVELTGVAENCAAPGNPQTVAVEAEQTTEVSFTITCEEGQSELGALTLEISTTGPGPGGGCGTNGELCDPDGYILTLSGVPFGSRLPLNFTLTVDSLPPGTVELALTDVATNCRVADGPTRIVTVVPGDTLVLDYDVTCTSSDAPTITNIEVADTLSNAPGDTIAWRVFFTDPNGDITVAHHVVIVDPNNILGGPGSTFDVDPDLGGATEGNVLLGFICPPGGCETGPLTLSLALEDAEGNQSASVEFSFVIAETGSSLTFRGGKGAAESHRDVGRVRVLR